MLWQPDVRRELAFADMVVPSLDAGGESVFQSVNRPHADISFREMLDGLIEFRTEFEGRYWLEVFLLAGYSATPAEVEEIAGCAKRIEPDRIQLNTATRPPAEDYAVSVTQDQLNQLATLFEPTAEVIADFRRVHQQQEFVAGRGSVLDLLRRRPCSVEDIANGLGMHRNEVVKYVEELAAEKLIESTAVADKLYYKVTSLA
jgi:wyosine [tRNA(Phe)-imidazoG37] synthetase (radical SAM superfamily)